MLHIKKNGVDIPLNKKVPGADDYTELTNKPQINGVTLSGNKTSADLGISGGGSNRNLLDNAWFTVNQKGFTSGVCGDYGLSRSCWTDRWHSTYGGGEDSQGTITYNNNHTITLTPNFTEGHSGSIAIMQRISNIEDLLDKVVTFSCYMNDEIYSYTAKLLDNSNIGTTITLGSTKLLLNMFVETRPDRAETNCLFLGIMRGDRTITPSLTSVTIKAVKLELGSESTLDLDVAPDYTTELLKCQRYYHKYRTQSLRPTYKEDCVPEMRINPTHETITIDGVTYYVNNAEL